MLRLAIEKSDWLEVDFLKVPLFYSWNIFDLNHKMVKITVLSLVLLSNLQSNKHAKSYILFTSALLLFVKWSPSHFLTSIPYIYALFKFRHVLLVLQSLMSYKCRSVAYSRVLLNCCLFSISLHSLCLEVVNWISVVFKKSNMKK